MSWVEQAGRVADAKFRRFGRPVLYTPEGSTDPPLALVGDFRRDAVLLDASADSQVSSVSLALDLRVADVPPDGPQARARVSIDGTTYSISTVEGPDDAGVVRCLLRVVLP